MKKFFTLIAAAFVAMSVNAEPKQWVLDGENTAFEYETSDPANAWNGKWWGFDAFDAMEYDYIWIEYDVDSFEGPVSFGIQYDEFINWQWGGKQFKSESTALSGKYGIVGIKLNKTDLLQFEADMDNAVKDDEGNITSVPQKAHTHAGDAFASRVVGFYLQNQNATETYVDIKGVFFGTEAEFIAAQKENGVTVYVYGEAKDVLEGKDMASYIRVQIGPDGAVAKDQPANGGVEDGVATINVRSKEDALGDNPTFSQWFGSYKADDESTWTAENVATWDTQAFIKLPKALNFMDKVVKISFEAKAETAMDGISLGAHSTPGGYINGYQGADKLNLTTEWKSYDALVKESTAGQITGKTEDAYEDLDPAFQSIAFDVAVLPEGNKVYFRNVKVFVSEASEAGEDGITAVYELTKNGWVRYNLAGQKVDKSYKGIVIENGKKFIQK